MRRAIWKGAIARGYEYTKDQYVIVTDKPFAEGLMSRFTP